MAGINLDQLRSNIVLDGILLEDIKSGDELAIGDARIRISYICEPCRHLFDVAGFITDDRKTLNSQRGILGIVTNSGTISTGHEVIIRSGTYKRLADSNFDRFCQIVQSIPKGQYLSYSDIVFLMGAPTQYVRAIPTYIKKAEESEIDCSSIKNKEYLDNCPKEKVRDFSHYFQT